MVSVYVPDKVDESDVWHMPGRFILRSTGFAFDLVEKLRFTRSSFFVMAIIQTQKQQLYFQDEFASTIFPRLCDEETAAGSDRETFRMWYALAKRIRLGRSINPLLIERIRDEHARSDLAAWLHRWNSVTDEVACLQVEGEACFTDELMTLRTVLHDIVMTPRFQEALWLSNPGVYETGWHYYHRHWDANARPSKIKHLERRFYTYLQRFCAKNDTTSFFGPLNYGTCGEREIATYHRTPERIRDRRVFLAYWAVEALAERIASEPAARPYLIPRRHPAKRRSPESNLADSVYACSDGARRVLDIATHLHCPLEEILQSIETLTAQGWLLLSIVLPPAVQNPLEVLITTVRAWPDIPTRQHWLPILKELACSCEHFAAANLQERQAILASVEERFVALVGGTARRGEGKMFQDRTLLYEECLGNIADFHLSSSHHRTIVEALSPIAHLCTSFSVALWQDLRTAAEALFDTLSPHGKSIPFTRFISAWRRKFPNPPSSRRADAIQNKLCSLVVPYQHEHVCHLNISDLTTFYTELDHHIVFSPDILLAAADTPALIAGDFRVVLGEIHHGVQPVGWMLLFAGDPQGWQDALTTCLPQPTKQVTPANLLLGRRMKTAPPEFSGPSVQASAFSERLSQPDLSSLVLERRNGRLCLAAPSEENSLLFYPPSYGVPDALYAPFAAFSYPLIRAVPVRLPGHTPRIEIGNAIYQRERWDLATTALPAIPSGGASLELLIAFTTFRQTFGMPERVFVRTPAEPKPIYIDFQDVFALELLVHLVGQSDTITFTEMCPSPNELWLHDDNGHYCSEFRTVLSLSPSPLPDNTIANYTTVSRGEEA